MYKKQLLKLLFCPLFLLISSWAMAQNVSVTGKVTDEKGQVLPGVTVSIKGTTKGTNSDLNGKYVITANSNDVLIFSMVGFVKQEANINSRSTINITLKDQDQLLNEIVVIGYGSQKRRDVTGSIASVKGETFKDQPITNPISALQGRIAGVNVVESSGQPGAAPTITIRGLSSFYQPNPLYIVDGIRVGDVSNINVQDIASIDVLKDAASAAIYGSAAAGGVLLITTKKGTGLGTDPVINFSARYGVTKPKLVNLLDRDDFIKIQNIVHPAFFAGATKTDTLSNTDWVHSLYKNAVEQNYNVSVSGSSPVVNYLFSGFYNAQKGSYINNYSNIGGARINTDYKLSKYITVGEQLGISQRKADPVLTDLHNAPFRTQPIIPLRNEDGTFGTEPSGYKIQFGGPNSYAAAQTITAQDYTNNLQANVYADIKLPLHLNFRSTFGYSYYYYTRDQFQDIYNAGAVSVGNNTLYKNEAQSNQLLSNYVLSYNQSFGKHNISAVAGFEQITSTGNSLYTSMGSIGINGYSYVPTSISGAQTVLNGTYDSNSLIKSEFGRLNYNYNNRYYLSASIRQDANFSVFGPDKQRGVFPAASVGWNINEEQFFKAALPVINALKLRASYGSLGNSNIPPYSYAANYTQFNSTTGISGGAQGFAPGAPFQVANSSTKLPNPNVHWETVTEANVGIDGEALNGRLYFTAEWYNKNTKDMLYALQLPTSAGFTQPYFTNIGTANNRGFDFMVGFRDKVGKLGYDVSVNAGFNKNKLLSLSGAATDAVVDGYNYYNNSDAGFSIMSNQNITISKAGQPFGSFYGYKVLGIFQTDAEAAGQKVNGNVAHAGDLHYQDLDGNGVINQADKQIIGNPNPKLVYGINIHLNYQGFDLAMLFNGVMGVQLFNGVKAYEESLFSDGNTTSKVFGDSYLGSNGLTSQPRLGLAQNGGFTLDPNQNYSSVNSYFVENGSYLKLKNLQFGYTFSNGILRRLSIKSARVYVMANNVFTITKYTGLDPELGSSFTPSGYGTVTTQGIDGVTNYPQTRIYSAGLDLTF
ncbi:MAG: TonB-dependent receptor [Mucilaginibacter sp.]|nr:TonB-dependent receptor [Mucilaginibacter sp.]